MSFSEKSFSLLQRDVILFVANLCTGIVIARKLGPEMAGLWAILLLIPGYAEAFGRLKFDIAAVYFLSKKKSTIGEMTFLLHLTAIVASVFIILLFLYNFDWIYQKLYRNSNIDMKLLTYAVLAVIPLRMIFLNYSYLHIFREDIHTYNIMIICQAIVNSFFSIFLILVFNLNIVGALIGNILGLIASIIYGGFKLNIIEKVKPNFNISLLIEMTKYGFYQYISGIINYFQITVVELLGAIYLLPAQIAFFSLSKAISDVGTRMIPTAINILLLTRVSKAEDKYNSAILTAYSFRIIFIILCATWSLLVIFAKLVIFLLYGSKFYPMITILQIIFPGFVFIQSSTVFSSYFSGIGRSDLLAKIVILPLLMQSLLALVFIPKYGIIAGAITFLLSSTLAFFIHVLVFISLSSLSVINVIPQYDDFITIYKFVQNKIIHFKFVNLLIYKK